MVGRGPGDAVPLRAAGALIGPDDLAVRWTRIGCACGAAGDPTAFWAGDRRASTMFQQPAKKARDPRMRGQSAVDALRAGAVPAGTFSTPVREKLWRTRPQFSVHGGSPIPSPGGAGRGFAAALGSPHASAWLWPSNMVAAPTACDFGTSESTCSNRAPLGVLNRYVLARIACLS